MCHEKAPQQRNSDFNPMVAVGATALVASARRGASAAALSTTTRTCAAAAASPPPTASFVTLSFSGAGHLLPYHLGVASSLHRASTNGGKSSCIYDNTSTHKSQLPHVPVSLPAPIKAVSGSSSGAVAATVLVRLPHRIEEYADAFEEAGYDDAVYLLTLNATSLREVAAEVGMIKRGHVWKLCDYLAP